MNFKSISPHLWLSLISQFIMNTATFMFMPLLTIYLIWQLKFSTTEVSTVLAINLLTTRLFPMFTGPLADKLGYQALMMVGISVRVLGFLGFAFLHGFYSLSIMSFLIGLGMTLYSPAIY